MNSLDDKVTLTKLELKIIIEDAFVDGWNTKDDDWASAEHYLKLHKQYGDSCETTEALENLLND